MPWVFPVFCTRLFLLENRKTCSYSGFACENPGCREFACQCWLFKNVRLISQSQWHICTSGKKKRNFQYIHESLNCQFRQVLSTRNILFDDLYHSYNRYRHSDYKHYCFQTNLAEERGPHHTAILCLGICFHNTRRELNTVPTVEYYLMPFYKRTLTEMVPFHKHKPKI